MNNFINIKDITSKDLRRILEEAKKRKKKRKFLNTLDLDKDFPLQNKLVIQMFEKSSLRTRISFYIAVKQLGASVLTLRPDELHMKKGGESLNDMAKVLSYYADLFILRTNDDKKLKQFQKYLDIPLINGLSPNSHPTQILSDVLTIEEIKKKKISELNITWIGDNNNVLKSLIEASVKFSFNLNIGCPISYQPKLKLFNFSNTAIKKIKIFNNAKQAAKNADVIMTDKVISMNDKVNTKKKILAFKNFRIDENLLKTTKKNAIILHCLPRGDEISESVFKSKNSKIWEQAINRIHVQKAILLFCFGKLR